MDDDDGDGSEDGTSGLLVAAANGDWPPDSGDSDESNGDDVARALLL